MSLVERDCHFLITEHGCFQECFGATSIVLVTSAVSWSFNVLTILFTDSSYLFLRKNKTFIFRKEKSVAITTRKEPSAEAGLESQAGAVSKTKFGRGSELRAWSGDERGPWLRARSVDERGSESSTRV